MAQFGLQNALNKPKPTIKSSSGQLYQTSDEELQNLTKDMPAPPITPLGANMVGANPDVAKMTGSSAQKVPALREAIQAGVGQDLATAQRTKQVNATVSEADKSKMETAKKLQGLTSFDTRVDELKESKLAAATVPTSTAIFDTTKTAGNTALAAALTKLNTNPQDQQAILEANQALGNTSVLLTSDQLQKQYGADKGTQAAQAAAAAIAGAKGSDLTPGQLTGMGFSSLQDLASAIGADPTQIAGMSMADIAHAAQSKMTTDFGDVNSLQQAANDPYAGAAARAEARTKLRAMGATGIRSTESSVDKIADDLASALTVTINGKPMSIEEALSDDTITNFVTDYFHATPDVKAKMEKDEPGLTSFVKKHSDIFASAVADLNKGVQDFEATQVERAKAGDVGGASFSADVVGLLEPNAGKLGTEKVDLAAISPLFNEMTTNPNTTIEQKTAITSAVNNIAAKNPAIARDLLRMNIKDIQTLGLDTPAGQASYLAKVTSANYISKLNNKSSPDEVAMAFGFNSVDSLEKQLKEATAMERSGFFPGTDSGLAKLTNYIVRDKGGNIDTAATTKALQGMTPAYNASQLGQWKFTPSALSSELGTYTSTEGTPEYAAAKPFLSGGINTVEAAKLAHRINPTNFEAFMPAFKVMSPTGQAETMKSMMDNMIKGDSNSIIKDLNTPKFAEGKNESDISSMHTNYEGVISNMDALEAQANAAGNASLAKAIHGQARGLAQALASFDKNKSNIKIAPIAPTNVPYTSLGSVDLSGDGTGSGLIPKTGNQTSTTTGDLADTFRAGGKSTSNLGKSIGSKISSGTKRGLGI